ncbi:hypothetical protein [Rhodococcus sp. SORGH_AS_0301]|uniref:hypothetical protein n=1 Tax=Rhodococcus sp. SORGH_AS_0301 TaxID=3041780 RepID=UPI0027D7E5D8|nr:hypothetical protein [Rhodococcus sp. SORGH_AS_0301]
MLVTTVNGRTPFGYCHLSLSSIGTSGNVSEFCPPINTFGSVERGDGSGQSVCLADIGAAPMNAADREELGGMRETV